MRRYTSVRAARSSLEIRVIPGAEGLTMPEGNSAHSPLMGEGRAHPAGCLAGARTKRTAQ